MHGHCGLLHQWWEAKNLCKIQSYHTAADKKCCVHQPAQWIGRGNQIPDDAVDINRTNPKTVVKAVEDWEPGGVTKARMRSRETQRTWIDMSFSCIQSSSDVVSFKLRQNSFKHLQQHIIRRNLELWKSYLPIWKSHCSQYHNHILERKLRQKWNRPYLCRKLNNMWKGRRIWRQLLCPFKKWCCGVNVVSYYRTSWRCYPNLNPLMTQTILYKYWKKWNCKDKKLTTMYHLMR